MPRNDLHNKAIRLTQRLDHMVPDPDVTASANQKAAAELAALSAKLYWHIPDQSLSPAERLERLARAADNAAPDMANLLPATKKLEALKARIDELVPGDASHEKKIELLLAQLDAKVGTNQLSLHTTDKLEILGDPRARIAPEVKSVTTKKKNKDK